MKPTQNPTGCPLKARIKDHAHFREDTTALTAQPAAAWALGGIREDLVSYSGLHRTPEAAPYGNQACFFSGGAFSLPNACSVNLFQRSAWPWMQIKHFFHKLWVYGLTSRNTDDVRE